MRALGYDGCMWLRDKLRAWLGVNQLDAESVKLAKALIALRNDVETEKREIRKDIYAAQVKRDYAHKSMPVIDWETAEALNLKSLLGAEQIEAAKRS